MSDPIPQTDDTTSFIVKAITGLILGPKISPILAAWGIPLDPVTTGTIVATTLHKLHVIAKSYTGWPWL